MIALTLVDFVLFEDCLSPITRFKLLEKNQFVEYRDDIELIFVELPKFDKTQVESMSVQDKWIYFVQNAGSLKAIPEGSTSEFQQACEIINEANLS